MKDMFKERNEHHQSFLYHSSLQGVSEEGQREVHTAEMPPKSEKKKSTIFVAGRSHVAGLHEARPRSRSIMNTCVIFFKVEVA